MHLRPFVLCIGLVASCLGLLATEGRSQGSPTFIDAHVHLNAPDAWLDLVDRGAVDAAIVMRGRSATHEALLAAAARRPGEILPFVSVSPEHREYRGYWERDDPAIALVVDSLLSGGGFYGVGEISVTHFPGAGFPEADFDPSGRAMVAVFEAARRHSVPVTVHVEVTRIREFEELLDRFAEVPVIWAHGGYTPLVLADRLLAAHPNLIYELSARTWARHPRSPDYTILRDGSSVWPEWIELIERRPDRFVVGTDASLRSLESDEAKIRGVVSFLRQLDPQVAERVARGNLLRLLQLGGGR